MNVWFTLDTCWPLSCFDENNKTKWKGTNLSQISLALFSHNEIVAVRQIEVEEQKDLGGSVQTPGVTEGNAAAVIYWTIIIKGWFAKGQLWVKGCTYFT